EELVANVRNALRGASIRYTGLTCNDQTVTVRITDPSHIKASVDLLKPLTTAGGHSGSDVALQQGEEERDDGDDAENTIEGD
ncbi:hypothetical protein ACC724_39330, partial [Rhizobium ruizarguesonis]